MFSMNMVPRFNDDDNSSMCNAVKVPHIFLQRLGYIHSYASMPSKRCQSPSLFPRKIKSRMIAEW